MYVTCLVACLYVCKFFLLRVCMYVTCLVACLYVCHNLACVRYLESTATSPAQYSLDKEGIMVYDKKYESI